MSLGEAQILLPQRTRYPHSLEFVNLDLRLGLAKLTAFLAILHPASVIAELCTET